jgi:ureidoglycolate hydrolase
MNEPVLEIKEFDGEGYQPLIDHAAWRVAMLRWAESSQPDTIHRLERHTRTDEVFVLLKGRAQLILAGNSQVAGVIEAHSMESGRLYNVKRNAWHTLIMSREASILIVENRDTGDRNTEYSQLSEEMREEILALAESGI